VCSSMHVASASCMGYLRTVGGTYGQVTIGDNLADRVGCLVSNNKNVSRYLNRLRPVPTVLNLVIPLEPD
jgi:hypothetical protein